MAAPNQAGRLPQPAHSRERPITRLFAQRLRLIGIPLSLAAARLKAKSAILAGEMIVADAAGHPDFQALLGAPMNNLTDDPPFKPETVSREWALSAAGAQTHQEGRAARVSVRRANVRRHLQGILDGSCVGAEHRSAKNGRPMLH